ncbi:hypothetical protein REPUB_Repub14bG0063500 [Reevesia pubescens]
MEGKQKLLHGALEATIFDATPYTPPFPFNCMLANGKPTYVTIKLENKKVAKTSHECDRVWNQTFQILCAHLPDSTITIAMKNKCSILGKFCIQARQILNEASLINGFFPLQMENGKTNPKLKLRFMLWFKPAEFEPTWGKVLAYRGLHGLRNATFPQRSNCNVTLYQDAHHSSAFQPQFSLCGTPRKLWEDVYKAIEGEKHLIYIAGWSFNPKMVLVRDPQTNIPHARRVKLGELLKRKAEKDAFSYFKHSSVICKLCPRLHHKFPTLFTHHQKTITVDTRANSSSINDREIMCFVGGVDLCDGRYDIEQHSLFQTLNTESHCFDFYQINISGASLHKGGPREPWHDAHACITGEAAWDVLANFEQRWTKQCDPSLLLPTNSIPNLTRQPLPSSISNDRNWKVQVFRSIDNVSASQLFKTLTVEQSIHEAYVDAIRNLIPIEIALKVVSKIKAKERFVVYILIPMWPEGVPDSEPVQDILHWTRETMAMMYKLIGEATKESGEPGHPRDYLNFFCLANREKESKEDFIPPHSHHPSTQYWNVQKHRRFMVYVHSKVMIVDDLYILIGSANVNQISMDGQRDTEIAIGCYQLPSENPENNSTTARDIHAYRMSLWYEHTGLADVIFLEPQSLECVQKMRSLDVVDGDENFSDTKTPVKGRRSKVLPPIFTT